MSKIKSALSKVKCPAFIKKHKIISIIILVLIIAAIAFFAFKGEKKEVAVSAVSDYTVSKGDVSVTITGSGTLEANEQYEITSLVSGDVLSDYFQEGDLVNEDDILYQIDSSNAQNSLERAKNTYDDAAENVANLNVRSDISGTVTSVNTKKGAKVSANSVLFTVTDTSKLKLEINFNENDAAKIYAGANAEVYLTDSNSVCYGKVAQVANGSFISPEGVKVSQVIIEVDNPGTIVSGASATAIVNGLACASEGTFSDYDICEVTAQVAGDISKVNVVIGDKVNTNTILAVIESSSTRKSFREAQLSYSDAQESLDNYTIKAPITGTVLSKNVKAGDKLSAGGNNNTVMAIIADMTQMKFTISVDELDISKMQEGQRVTVTADALEGQRFEGYIDNISIVGTTQNSVTTYPVTVVVKEYGNLIPGMNVDAEINVSEARGVLCVPLSAVQRGNIVYVKNEDLTAEQKKNITEKSDKATPGKMPQSENRQTGAQNRFEGYTPIRVETGLSNSDMVEIKSGINEGQRIAVVTINQGSGQFNMMGMGGSMPGGMPGGMGGGMSGGMGNRMSGGMGSGMPGGGMR